MTETPGNASVEESDFSPLTPEQAQRLIAQNPSLSVWWVLSAQLVVGVLAAMVAGILTGQGASAWSAFYGCLAVVIPGALFARGLRSQFSSISAVTAGFGFFCVGGGQNWCECRHAGRSPPVGCRSGLVGHADRTHRDLEGVLAGASGAPKTKNCVKSKQCPKQQTRLQPVTILFTT